MFYSPDYFELQLNFAKKVSEITGENLNSVLSQYTSFFKTFRIEGWDFNPNNPIWQEFIVVFDKKSDIDTIYNFYLQRIKVAGEKNNKELFGCFSYEYNEKDKSISIHFRNIDTPEPGALSKERFETRTKELTKMFRQIRKCLPDVKTVTGFSWLYNIDAYNRLFPIEYIQSCQPVYGWFRSTALWGQFLDSAGNLKIDLVKTFNKSVAKCKSIEDLSKLFLTPYLKPKLISFTFIGTIIDTRVY